MIRPTRTHRQFLEFFQARREQLKVKVPHDATDLWCKFRRLDLSAAHPILARLYSPDQGRPGCPPVDLLRSWLLMLECHITSVPVWVHRLKEQPFYALLCGFDPDQVPTDRRGIADSMRGRIRRHGGSVTIISSPGEGTEVQLRLPRSQG